MQTTSSPSIIPIPAFKDNYIWMFFAAAKKVWVVDPGDAQPVMQALKQNDVDLAGILITHHHHDHSGGVAELLSHWKNIQVVGSQVSRVSSITHPVESSAEVICGSVRLRALAIPGHTLDHMAFYNNEILFCGDTLFSVGCGRIFEGTPEQMYNSLTKLRALPTTIKIYCGHEYTLANLQFAQHVEPNNPHIAEKTRLVKKLLAENKPTLPAILQEEKLLNPFLRCDVPDVVHAAEQYANKTLKTPVEVFACLREWKNNFK